MEMLVSKLAVSISLLLLAIAIWPGSSTANMTEIKIERHSDVPMRYGVKLYADVYLPSAEGRYPVLVVRTPYGVQRDAVHETMIKFAQRGYAVVMNDVRGRYESEGKWEPFRTEAADGYA